MADAETADEGDSAPSGTSGKQKKKAKTEPVDKFACLKPACKVITLIEAKRIMSTFEEKIQMVELVSCLQYAMQFMDRFSGVFGSNLIELLVQHRYILRSFIDNATRPLVDEPVSEESDGAIWDISATRGLYLLPGEEPPEEVEEVEEEEEEEDPAEKRKKAKKKEEHAYKESGTAAEKVFMGLPGHKLLSESYHLVNPVSEESLSVFHITPPDSSFDSRDQRETLVTSSCSLPSSMDTGASARFVWDLRMITAFRRHLVRSYTRLTVENPSLYRINVQLTATFREIMRRFRKNTVAMEAILPYGTGTVEIKALEDEIEEFRKIMFERFRTTAEEVRKRTEFMHEVLLLIIETDYLTWNLEEEIRIYEKKTIEIVNELNDKIQFFKGEIISTSKLSDEFIRQTRIDADKVRAWSVANGEKRNGHLLKELQNRRSEYNKLKNKHWGFEFNQRQRKLKIEQEIENWIIKYDQDMGDLQDEYDEVAAIYKIEKAQLDDLEERFILIDTEFTAIMEEREIAYQERKIGKHEERRHQFAARTIQGW